MEWHGSFEQHLLMCVLESSNKKSRQQHLTDSDKAAFATLTFLGIYT